jgi:hypothetical protein
VKSNVGLEDRGNAMEHNSQLQAISVLSAPLRRWLRRDSSQGQSS